MLIKKGYPKKEAEAKARSWYLWEPSYGGGIATARKMTQEQKTARAMKGVEARRAKHAQNALQESTEAKSE